MKSLQKQMWSARTRPRFGTGSRSCGIAALQIASGSQTASARLDISVRDSYRIAVFTGLIEEVGSTLWIRATDHGTQLQIAAPRLADEIGVGDSMAVNGCCLTVVSRRPGQLTFDVLDETLERTNLKTLRRDSPVNLERALPANGRIGGHFVQGHVDCSSRVISFERSGNDHRLEIELPAEFAHYAVYKGSIAINGISLTIAEILPASFAVWIIPHTKHQTNIDLAKPGDWVNVEFDILAKYLERMLARYVPQE